MDMGIYGYMDIQWILHFLSNFRQMSSNVRRIFVKCHQIFVKFPFKFLKIRQIFVKCHPNVVNLGPWANELEDKWILYT